LESGKKLRIWEDELCSLKEPPYAVGKDSLFLAYYASSEMGCHLALGWSMPQNVLDLYAEFCNLTNGLTPPCGTKLLGALAYFGLGGIEAAEKDSMQALAIRGGPWTPEEQRALLDYCESDVVALAKLLPKMNPKLDMPRALLRGRYMKAVAQVEHIGIPIDTEALSQLRQHWESIQDDLITQIDARYRVYEGRTFKRARFAAWLTESAIPWPRLASGILDLKDDTFRQMARAYPEVAPLRELRAALSQMRSLKLAVGRDGRNRCMLSAFQARTSRNQPKSSEFIFGPAAWLRGLIRPQPGWGLAYIDWEQQEFGIAAVLSQDALMIEAYQSGDSYLTLAKQAGAIPPDATKESHSSEREQFKILTLAVQYGMQAKTLATLINRPVVYAKQMLQLHRKRYHEFWRWSDGTVDYAMLHKKLRTTFGWTTYTGVNPNLRFLRNFLMQANGAEMLRLACCFIIEQGVRVCAPVHDAILIEAPLDKLEETIAITQEAMSEASATVLGGFRLRSEVKIVRYPDRYMDERGVRMWNTVWGILKRLKLTSTCALVRTLPVRECTGTCSQVHPRTILLSICLLKILKFNLFTASNGLFRSQQALPPKRQY
jgi:hypothetical protein